jgi:NadR type nicotinamide-nucleotide adenylyltransferase
MRPIKKIVILGPESTGKSSLCEELARHYKTLWCPEYARDYLLKHGKEYSYDDLLLIAKGQLAAEDACISKMEKQFPTPGDNVYVFLDTDMYVMKVWCEFAFSKCHSFILEQIVERTYDLYLLCNIDLTWIADDFREYPDLESREKLYAMYKDILINQSVPWVEISGDAEKRLTGAIGAINKHF